MGDGVVEPLFLQLRTLHLRAALDTLGIRLAEGKMAGGVLVKERVVEQEALVGNGAVVRNKRDLAEIRGALVHGDGGSEELLAPVGAAVNDPAVPDRKADAVDDVSVVHERHRGADRAVDAGFERSGEDLLRGHVGDKALPGRTHGAAGRPQVRFRQLDRKVGAEGIGVVQGLEVQGVERVPAPLKRRQMLLPAFDRPAVAADAHGGKDRVPELRLRVVRIQSGKDLLRP